MRKRTVLRAYATLPMTESPVLPLSVREEVKKGNIGTIIVKDMSRLGRNYVQMGMLREQLRVGLWQNREIKNPYKWGSSTIAHILQKHEYLGHTVNFKTRKHFKDKKSHYVDKDQWLIFEDTPAPIIDQEPLTTYSALEDR